MDTAIPPHLLGHDRSAAWLDMSRFAVHFTKSEEAFVSILKEGFLRPGGPYGWGRKVNEVQEGHFSACFSEIPLSQIRRLIERHGSWGIGFKKAFLARNGGGRVWYVDDETPLHDSVFAAIGQLRAQGDFSSSWWKATPFMDLVSPVRHYAFDWEREWRVPGGLHFRLADVAFVWVGEDEAGGQKIIEDVFVEPRPPWSPTGEVIGSLESNVEALGPTCEQLLESFFEEFSDPIDDLYYDEGGGYVWPVPPVSTEEAVLEVCGDLEETLRSALTTILDDVALQWIRKSDWEAARE
jgi:hypothetical protein